MAVELLSLTNILPFSSSLHRIFTFTFTFIDLLLHRSTASTNSRFHHLFIASSPSPSSIYCFIDLVASSSRCFIIFFHQEHLLVASSSPSPSSAFFGISDLVRCVAYGGCSHCMLLTYRKKRWNASIKPTGIGADADKIVLDSVPSGSSGVVVSASVGDDMGLSLFD
ncbi:hypothetical protein QVD17_38309 [Tagetes erecta]|uniref:Uncharacterized protein n=1 Tax=Tagetes erecta TaxID=13708 RepID=A0AAD8JN67_TARER|nr:hypothetical protein QVD17_38309 [Tagetes erecta]